MRDLRILVCGGRDYRDDRFLAYILDHYYHRVTVIIHGDATGADRLAKEWAIANNIPHLPFPADWERYKKKAGIIRNTQMIHEGYPDLVIAFRGGRGTHDMITQSKHHHIDTLIL